MVGLRDCLLIEPVKADDILRWMRLKNSVRSGLKNEVGCSLGENVLAQPFAEGT